MIRVKRVEIGWRERITRRRLKADVTVFFVIVDNLLVVVNFGS